MHSHSHSFTNKTHTYYTKSLSATLTCLLSPTHKLANVHARSLGHDCANSPTVLSTIKFLDVVASQPSVVCLLKARHGALRLFLLLTFKGLSLLSRLMMVYFDGLGEVN